MQARTRSTSLSYDFMLLKDSCSNFFSCLDGYRRSTSLGRHRGSFKLPQVLFLIMRSTSEMDRSSFASN